MSLNKRKFELFGALCKKACGFHLIRRNHLQYMNYHVIKNIITKYKENKTESI